ncbi:MAG: restriction endonuclease [Thermofilaceae archaeon]
MTNYQKGRNFEYLIRKKLESKGFLVIRSAGSKGLFDLVAIKENEVYLIQCKKNKNNFLYDLKNFYNAIKNLHLGEKIRIIFAFTTSKEVSYEELRQKVQQIGKEIILFEKGRKQFIYFIYF